MFTQCLAVKTELWLASIPRWSCLSRHWMGYIYITLGLGFVEDKSTVKIKNLPPVTLYIVLGPLWAYPVYINSCVVNIHCHQLSWQQTSMLGCTILLSSFHCLNLTLRPRHTDSCLCLSWPNVTYLYQQW